MVKVACPSCNGSGTTTALVCYRIDHQQSSYSRVQTMPCTRCRGEKEVSEETFEWTAQGERMREARLERRLSQGAAARLLGISPMEYSQVEHGMAAPVDYSEILRQKIVRSIQSNR